MRFWKVDFESTLNRYITMDVTISEKETSQTKRDVYQTTYLNKRARQNEWLRKFGDYLTSRPVEFEHLMHKFELHRGPTGAMWHERMAPYIGASNITEAMHLLSNTETDYQIKILRGLVFQSDSNDWKHLLVIPFQELPGVTCGCLAVGREGEKEDFRFIPFLGDSWLRNHSVRTCESGVAMYDVLWQDTHQPGEFKKTKFVAGNTMSALRIQSRHLKDNVRPLPIVGAYTGRSGYKDEYDREYYMLPRKFWHTNPSYAWIFWDTVLTPDLVSMAAHAGGRIVIAPDPGVHDMPTVSGWLLGLRSKAEHWMTVLENAVATLPTAGLLDFFNRLFLSDELLAEFEKTCTERNKGRLQLLKEHVEGLRSVWVNSKVFQEDQLGLVSGLHYTRVTDAKLRFDKMLVDPDTDDIHYQGRILYHGHTVPFEMNGSEMPVKGLQWMRGRIRNAGLGELAYAWSFEEDMLQVSLKMYPPKVEYVKDLAQKYQRCQKSAEKVK